MLFNLNEYLMAVSLALDFVAIDVFGVAINHSKRVAYISTRIANRLGFSEEEIFDIISLSIMHDNGASQSNASLGVSGSIEPANIEAAESKLQHCIIGEENIKNYPFITSVENVIKYHHENYDGSGFLKIKGDDIPIMSQIIRIADEIELTFSLKDMNLENKKKVREFVKCYTNSLFAPKIAEAFIDVSETPYFWLDLKDEFIDDSIKRYMTNFTKEFTFNEIQHITKVLSKIIDSKSRFTRVHSQGLCEKAKAMGRFYKKPEEEIYKLMIAADLHDIGKLAVSNSILDKPGKLNESEIDIIQRHTYYTRRILQEITGFEDITEWASNHHERLNGRGYPFRKSSHELDFNSRLMACLDVFQALTEERPYRKPMPYKDAFEILSKMAQAGSIDREITMDVLKAFDGISFIMTPGNVRHGS